MNSLRPRGGNKTFMHERAPKCHHSIVSTIYMQSTASPSIPPTQLTQLSIVRGGYERRTQTFDLDRPLSSKPATSYPDLERLLDR